MQKKCVIIYNLCAIWPLSNLPQIRDGLDTSGDWVFARTGQKGENRCQEGNIVEIN